jgi:uncharacterized membrane protein YfcA
MSSAVPLELIVFVSACFMGALVAGVAGFAFGLIASAIWLHAITPAQSAALIAAFAIIIQGATLWKLRHALQISRLLPFLLGGALGIPLGAEILRWASPSLMRSLVGLALVLFSTYGLVRPKLMSVNGSKIADGLVGVASGFMGGSTGLAGIPVIVWSTLRAWSKDEQRAVFQPVVVAIFAMTLAWLGGSGLITSDTVRLFLLGLPAVLLGTWLGFRLYGRLDEATFRIVVLVLLLISGMTLLPSALLTST